jgi:hypothetical protein
MTTHFLSVSERTHSHTRTPHLQPTNTPSQIPDLAAAGEWDTLATEARRAMAFLLESGEGSLPPPPPLPLPAALRSEQGLRAALGFAQRLWACEGDPWEERWMDEEKNEEEGEGGGVAVAGRGGPASSSSASSHSVYEACLQVSVRAGARGRGW